MTLTNPSYVIDTTFSSKNIASAASVYQFTAAASAKVQFIVKLTNAAGGGDYVVYIKRQWLGAGTASVVLPKTTATAVTGETVIEFVTIQINVKATDVLDVMIDGLAGDTSVNGDVRIVADNPSVFDAANDTVTISAASVDAVWDESASGHNVNNSYGKRIKQITDDIIYSGTVSSYVASNIIRLDSGADSTDGAYDPCIIVFTAGTGAVQVAQGIEYTGSTRQLILRRDLKFPVDGTTTYNILASSGTIATNDGLLVSVTGTNKCRLNVLAPTDNDTIKDQILHFTAGPNADAAYIIDDYDGPTQTVTIRGTWTSTPTAQTSYEILPFMISDYTDEIALTVLQQFFTQDSGLDWNDAVDGSLVKEVLDGIPPSTLGPASVWSYSNRTLTSPSGEGAPVISKTLTAYRDATIIISLTDLGSISNRDRLWITVKRDPLDPDQDALIQVEETAGLMVISGQAVPVGSVTATDGDITIDDQATGNITLEIKPVAAVLLSTADGLYYDAKVRRTTTGRVDPLAIGRLNLKPTITRAIS